MKNSIGNHITVTLFGESHGMGLGAIIDGMAPGVTVDTEYIAKQMELRKPHGKISTQRKEADEVKILSGVFEGKTTGTPISLVIENAAQHSKDYSKTKDLARPGHADYTANEKYHGYQDYRGGGHFSGRITAALVAAGAIAKKALEDKGIYIGTHIAKCGTILDREMGNYEEDIQKLNDMLFPVLDEAASKEMLAYMEAAAAEGDSVGGVLQTVVTGMPAGAGEPWFDTVESMLAHAMFSVPAVKGVEFGKGFGFAQMKGSEANDSFYMEGHAVKTRTNNNGGINGGITNGMPIVFQCVVKPTPSIYKEQDTINMQEREDAKLQIQGRHDPAIIHRARVVVDSMTALVLADILTGRYGTDYLKSE